MRCVACGFRGEPSGRVFNCPDCGSSTPLPDVFQPVDVGGRTTLTKEGGRPRVIDGSGHPRKANGEFGVEVPS
jgi:hypothetical protein